MHRPTMRAIRGAARLAGVLLATPALAAACGAAGPGGSPTEVITTFTLTSAAFAEGGAIPREHTCDGRDASPPLSWADAPAKTTSFALVVDDPDAGGFVHWVAFNLPASASGSLPAGYSASPDAPPQGRNDFGRIGYGGPCPPSGTHRYAFRMLALDAMLPLAGTPSAAAVLAAARGHVLAEARLQATYRRGS
jgi:Raf kinase inhibitor-like YbhB/YbcL family protein